MKKIAVVLLLAFVTLLVASACNRDACPAYSSIDIDTEQSDFVG